MRRTASLLAIILLIAGVATVLFPLINKTKKLAKPMESVFTQAAKEAQGE